MTLAAAAAAASNLQHPQHLRLTLEALAYTFLWLQRALCYNWLVIFSLIAANIFLRHK